MVLTLQGAMPREKDFSQTLSVNSNGFSLYAEVRCAADDRPALANERVQIDSAGQVVLKLKTA